MNAEITTEESVEARARAHRLLGDPHRLHLVECLAGSDHTPGELADLTGMSSNLLAFHLRALEEAGLVERRRSEGDSRRRYVSLRWERLPPVPCGRVSPPVERILFVCTHNSARSQFAEAMWRSAGDPPVWSAGTAPADRVHPGAVTAAREFGIDLSGSDPKGFDAVPDRVDLVVSVCDRAFESSLFAGSSTVHWSIPDPVSRDEAAFTSAFADIGARIDRLRHRLGRFPFGPRRENR